MGLVFRDTKVIISQVFLDKMPTHMNKTVFFEDCVSSANCSVTSNNETYFVEGLWEEILKIHDMLYAALERWSSGEPSITDVKCSIKVPVRKQNVDEDEALMHNDAEDITELTLGMDHSQMINETKVGSNSTTIDIIDQSQCLLETEVVIDEEIQQPCLDVPEDNMGNQIGAADEFNSSDSGTTEAAPENELCVDIQLEHNYNHFRDSEKMEHSFEAAEHSIENEIYMDIKLSKPTGTIFSDPNMPVTLVVAKEDDLGVEVVQLNVKKSNKVPVSQKNGEANISSNNQEQLKQRRKKYEESTPYKYFCSQCSFKTKRHSHMRKHARLHEKVCTIYSCDQCDFSTIRASHLQRHMGTHKTEVFACSECTFSTHTEACLTKHQRYKHILKKDEDLKIKSTYQCLQCAYVTSSEKFFERHLSVHTKKRRAKDVCFKCNKCSYQTPSQPNYARHLLVHGNERPYMCSTCGLCFKRSDTLAQHQVTHVDPEQEGTFSCLKCKKCFRSASALKEHQLTHEQERSYLCEICAASFKTRAVQRKHYKEKHVYEKVHSCSSCSKTFNSKYLLKRHMKVHAPIRPRTQALESQQAIAPNDWCNSLVPIGTATKDVQVIVVHQEPEISDQEGSLFHIASSVGPGHSLSVPMLPVKYVIPAADVGSATDNSGTALCVANDTASIPSCDEEIIALTFVQDGT